MVALPVVESYIETGHNCAWTNAELTDNNISVTMENKWFSFFIK
ncbi:hypothetical protein BGP_5342 [Beggiatoa sp. PS]|nr:hypothetical protein BGP_5342 [Beggiatoa sp. PS]